MSVSSYIRASRRIATGLFTLLLATSAWAKVKLEVTPLFGTTVPPGTCMPLEVRILNDGPSVNATLIIDASLGYGGSRRYLYPVSLPSGSAKEVLALPFISLNASSITLHLTGVHPRLEEHVPVTSQQNARLVVGVGDEIGGLEFLRAVNSSLSPVGKAKYPSDFSRPEWLWSYCRPEDVPDRAAGLTAARSLVLGSGAERLSPAQWQAIRNWMLLGGVLYAPGGAAAVYLRHAKLNDILPLQNLRTIAWSKWGSLETALRVRPPSGAAFITEGMLASGAELITPLEPRTRDPMVAFRPFGAGGVFFSAFNIWDKPFRGWQGLPEMWRLHFAPRAVFRGDMTWNFFFSSLEGLLEQEAQTTFKMPSALSLTLTLIAYFILAVPVSYTILKRLRRLDLHWVTAPIIALIFVFIVGRSAGGLYRLGNQNSARGVVVAASGDPNAYMFASTTLFLQRAGGYSLDFGAGEAAFSSSWPAYSDYGASLGATSLDTVEGRSVATVIRVPNLAYRLFYWAQPVALPGTIDVWAKREKENLALRIKNNLTVQLRNITVPWFSSSNILPRQLSEQQNRLEPDSDLPPGQSVETRISLKIPVPSQQGKSKYYGGPGGGGPPGAPPVAKAPVVPQPATTLAVLPQRLMITVQIDGLDIAPRLNVSAERRSHVLVRVYFPIQ